MALPSSTKSSLAVDYLTHRIQQAEQDLGKIEQKLYDAETEYFSSESSQMGTALKGYEGFLSSKDNLRKRARTFKIEDRLFSLSSRTSPAAKEEERVNDEHLLSKQEGLHRSRSERKLLSKRSRSQREFKHARSASFGY